MREILGKSYPQSGMPCILCINYAWMYFELYILEESSKIPIKALKLVGWRAGWRFYWLSTTGQNVWNLSPAKLEEKKCKRAKWLSEEGLQIAVKRREVKSKGEKERYSQLSAEFQRIARREKTAFLSDQFKEIEENNRMGRLEISSRKLEIPREHFMQR